MVGTSARVRPWRWRTVLDHFRIDDWSVMTRGNEQLSLVVRGGVIVVIGLLLSVPRRFA